MTAIAVVLLAAGWILGDTADRMYHRRSLRRAFAWLSDICMITGGGMLVVVVFNLLWEYAP